MSGQDCRRRAKDMLHIKRLDDNAYEVWGGVDSHLVWIENGIAVCDCIPFTRRQTYYCSHIAKHELEYNQRPRNRDKQLKMSRQQKKKKLEE